MIAWIKKIFAILIEPLMPPNQHIQPVPEPDVPVQETPAPVVDPFDTQEGTRIAIREICDEMGLPIARSIRVGSQMYAPKDIICACIYQESEFRNRLPDGSPTIHRNYVNGVLTSTDWGLCQINDTKGWYIGPPPLPFPSVDFLVDNPGEAVKFMVRMYQEGLLKKWVSYSSGAYQRWLPHVRTPVPASGHYE